MIKQINITDKNENKQLTQERNFDEVEFISGYVMRLIKLTEQNIKLQNKKGKIRVHRNYYKVEMLK